jgi:O-acetyl-ADP-ribose deacetylase (regulator of RNase III)
VAGRELLEKCHSLGGCATGEARLTRGYNLPARWVIHAVGPRWRDGKHGEPNLLASAYCSCMRLADVEHQLRSVAFPSISTGVYYFPLEGAAPIAVGEVARALAAGSTVEQVVFVCFDPRTSAVYQGRAD